MYIVNYYVDCILLGNLDYFWNALLKKLMYIVLCGLYIAREFGLLFLERTVYTIILAMNIKLHHERRKIISILCKTKHSSSFI